MPKPRKTSDSDIMTVEEVATYLKVTDRSIYTLLTKEQIPAFKVGGSWRFRRDEIDAWTRRSHSSNKKKRKVL